MKHNWYQCGIHGYDVCLILVHVYEGIEGGWNVLKWKKTECFFNSITNSHCVSKIWKMSPLDLETKTLGLQTNKLQHWSAHLTEWNCISCLSTQSKPFKKQKQKQKQTQTQTANSYLSLVWLLFDFLWVRNTDKAKLVTLTKRTLVGCFNTDYVLLECVQSSTETELGVCGCDSWSADSVLASVTPQLYQVVKGSFLFVYANVVMSGSVWYKVK